MTMPPYLHCTSPIGITPPIEKGGDFSLDSSAPAATFDELDRPQLLAAASSPLARGAAVGKSVLGAATPLLQPFVRMSRLSKAWRSTRVYRHLAAKRLPKLLIIGAQKGGTSALYSYLAQHPLLAPSVEKEVEFFGSELRYAQGLEWYASQWHYKTPRDAIRFEASPVYMVGPHAPERIKKILPGVKLIAVLRDPVLRAYSAWQMYRRQLESDPDFYEKLLRDRYTPEEGAKMVRRTPAEMDDFYLAVQREAACVAAGKPMLMSVLELGLYGPQLKRYADIFPREQLLILDSNDLRTRRVHTLNRVLRFIGLPQWNWTDTDLTDVFVGKWSAPMPERARDFLREYYRDSNRMLAEMMDVPPLFVRDDVRRMASA